MRLLAACGLLLLSAACARERIDAVGARYAPPQPFAFAGVDPGPPPTANFGHGLTLVRSPFAPPADTDDAVAYADALVAQGALERGARGTHLRAGTLPAGPCVKLELEQGGQQGMVYVLPRAHGYLLLRYVEGGRDFNANALRIEQSLARLRADP